MADLSVTAASVVEGTDAVRRHGIAGATVTAGQPVYKDSTDSNQLKPTINSAAASAVAVGIALHAASDEQPLAYISSGNLNPGATVVVGEIYCVSVNSGGIAPEADVLSADYMTVLGVGSTSSNIQVDIQVSGIALP